MLLAAPACLWAQGGLGVPVVEVLEGLAARDGLHFSYRTDALAGLTVLASPSGDTASLLPAVRAVLAGRGLVLREAEPGRFLVGGGSGSGRGVMDPAGLADRMIVTVSDGEGPLVGATLLAPDGRGWVTDEDGRAALPGRALPAELEVQYVGYAATTLSTADIRRAGGMVRLSAKPYTTPAAVVTAPLPSRVLGPLREDGDAPGGFGESRLALLPSGLDQAGFIGMAGASGIDGGSAKPALRGSGADETLIVMDGLPLFHVDHFFGLFPAIAPATVARMEVYRSHYPVQWGGYRGGMIDVGTRAPAEGLGLRVDASQVMAGAVAEGRVGKVSGLVSGRTTLQGVFGDSLFGNDTPDYRFGEGYARLRYGDEGDRWRAEWNGFASRDAYDFLAPQSFSIERSRRTLDYVGAFTEQSDWTNAGTRAAVYFQPAGVRYGLDAYVSTYGQDLAAASRFRLERRPNAAGFAGLDNALRNRVRERQVGLSAQRSGAGVGAWTAGVQVQRFDTEATFRFRERTLLDAADADTRLSAYGAYDRTLGKSLDVSAGLRATQSVTGDQGWWSPRLQLSYRLSDGEAAAPALASTLRAGYSYTRQNVRSLQHENQYGQLYPVYVLEVGERGEAPAAHAR